MLFLLEVALPTEATNKIVRDDPDFLRKLEGYVAAVKPQAAYVHETGGQRGFLLVIDVPSADRFPSIIEPLWQQYNASVRITPVFTLDDMKKGLEQLMRQTR